jgi:hypothetical protein
MGVISSSDYYEEVVETYCTVLISLGRWLATWSVRSL